MEPLDPRSPQAGELSSPGHVQTNGSRNDPLKSQFGPGDGRQRSLTPQNKRTIMKVVPTTTTRARQRNLPESLSQSEPNLSFEAEGFDDDDTFAPSVSDWSAAIVPSRRDPTAKNTGITSVSTAAKSGTQAGLSRKAFAAPQGRSASFRSKMPSSNAVVVPPSNSGAKTTKIKASELGIRIGKDTTTEQVQEAVKRWKAEQKSKESSFSSDPPAQSNTRKNTGMIGTKHAVTERQFNTAVESPEFAAFGSNEHPLRGERREADQKSSKKIVIRRRRSDAGLQSSPQQPLLDKESTGETPKRDPSGMKYNRKPVAKPPETLAASKPVSSVAAAPNAPPTPSTPSKFTVAELKVDAQRAVRRGRSKSPSDKIGGTQQSRANSKGPRTERPKRRSKSPASGLASNRTPSQRENLNVTTASDKGRGVSKSPIRGADYRPVSWRLEDSSMHDETEDTEKDGPNKSHHSRLGPRSPAPLDENDEVQKRLRAAGISANQYRAMLAAGLTVGIV